MATRRKATKAVSSGVKCAECGHVAHVLLAHLRDEHGLTAMEYSEAHPGAPLFSDVGGAVLQQRLAGSAHALAQPEREFEWVTVDEVFGTKGEEYEVKRFTDEAAWVPPGDDDGYVYDINATLALLYALHRERRNSCWIAGYAGTGKTQLVLNVCRRLQREVIRVNLDSSITRGDIIGDWTVRNGETVFKYGLLPQAMKRGAVLLLDEFDLGNPYVIALFRPVLEENPRLVILENGGEVIIPHEDFRVVVTANTFGAGDTSGLYGTTQSLSLADRQRFSLFIEMDYLSKSKEKLMLLDAVEDLDEDEAEILVNIATRIRDAYKEGQLEESISPRQLVNWAEVFNETGNAVYSANMSFLLPLGKSSRMSIKTFIEEAGLAKKKV